MGSVFSYAEKIEPVQNYHKLLKAEFNEFCRNELNYKNRRLIFEKCLTDSYLELCSK